MKLASLHDLFIEQLQDLYDAEQRLMEALPKMAKAANNDDLAQAFETHLEQTEGHVERLEQVFKSIDEKAKRKTCHGIMGLIQEGEEFVKGKDMEPAVQDAGLIAAAQRVEHYEIAGYGCAVAFARTMGHDEAVKLLEETKNEEVDTDQSLTELAEKDVNLAAHELDPEEMQDKKKHGKKLAGVH
jgi:ferritin-like metal-binding protein YciE